MPGAAALESFHGAPGGADAAQFAVLALRPLCTIVDAMNGIDQAMAD